MKYCQFCGAQIAAEAVVCPRCGRQVAPLHGGQPPVVINNQNTTYTAPAYGTWCNKWVAFFLCLFLGMFGAHKFYEGKAGMGLLYLFTLGLFGIGWMIDLIVLLFKRNPYRAR